MKKRTFTVLALALFATLLLCAFTVDTTSSIKSLTKPYINTYECVYARLGDEDLLEKYEYLKITLKESEELEVTFKRPQGKKHIYGGYYKFDDKTGIITAEIGILGFRFRQASKIVNGSFSIAMPMLGKTLHMVFKA